MPASSLLPFVTEDRCGSFYPSAGRSGGDRRVNLLSFRSRRARGFLLGLITEQPDLMASHSGGPLDAAMRGLQTLPGVCLTSLPRMADFALWATACGTALWPAGTFARAYDANRKAAVEEIIEADPVAVCVRKLMAERSTWAGTAPQPRYAPRARP